MYEEYEEQENESFDEAENQEGQFDMDAPQFNGDVDIDADVVIPLMDSREITWRATYEKMQKELRGWGWSSIILGVIHFISFGALSPSWGISLLGVGGMSFLFSEASMFVVYAVIIAWVGTSNVFAGGLGSWTIFGIIQVILSYQLYRKYQGYREAEKQYLAAESAQEGGQEKRPRRAEELFPAIGVIMSITGLVGTLAIFGMLVLLVYLGASNQILEYAGIIDMVMGVFFASGIIGFGLCVAAVVAEYKGRVWSWIGVAAGVLLIGFELYLQFS